MMRDDAYLDDLSQMFHVYRLGVDNFKQHPFHRVPMGVAVTRPEAQRIERIFLCTISSLIAAIVSNSTVGLRHCHHSTVPRTLIYKIFTHMFISNKVQINRRRTFRTITRVSFYSILSIKITPPVERAKHLKFQTQPIQNL